MTTVTATRATTERFRLAEGPVWDHTRDRLLWVDIPAGAVHEGRLTGSRVTVTATHHVDRTVGAVVPALDGRLLVAGRTSVVVLEPDGTPGAAVPVLPDVQPPHPQRRLNDGACDPAGRFCVGSLSLGAPPGAEVLCRVEDDGTLTVLDDDLGLSNGLAWSPDGSVLYSVDTLAGRVWARPYEPSTGRTGPRREHLHIEGLPDGITTDADGNLWIAVWGAGQVRCYSPGGALLHTIEVPAPQTSSVTFAGPRHDVLVITTAREGLSGPERDATPDSGCLFVATVPGAVGRPATPWNGRPATGAPSAQRS